jgi:hypothetical protein
MIVELLVVPPRYGDPDRIEMFAVDSTGDLWHRFSDPAGGWTAWERDHTPEDEE